MQSLETPTLLLSQPKMAANIARMQQRIAALGVAFRPHVKTAKCLPVARAMLGADTGPITVSTLREADEFAAAGFTDITYAVGISANKLAHVARLLANGVSLKVILDSVDAARAVVAVADGLAAPLGVLIEIDTDAHRAGIAPTDAALLAAVAAALQHPKLQLQGVLTHLAPATTAAAPPRCRPPPSKSAPAPCWLPATCAPPAMRRPWSAWAPPPPRCLRRPCPVSPRFAPASMCSRTW